MIAMSHGWAVYVNDAIDMRTVSETRRAALVNWLHGRKGVFIYARYTDDQIELLWQDHRGEARAIPVRVQSAMPEEP